jgi:hypothetical protein
MAGGSARFESLLGGAKVRIVTWKSSQVRARPRSFLGQVIVLITFSVLGGRGRRRPPSKEEVDAELAAHDREMAALERSRAIRKAAQAKRETRDARENSGEPSGN